MPVYRNFAHILKTIKYGFFAEALRGKSQRETP